MKFPPRPSRPREIPSIFSWCSGEARNRLSLQYSMHVDFSLSLYVYIYIYIYIHTYKQTSYIYIYIYRYNRQWSSMNLELENSPKISKACDVCILYMYALSFTLLFYLSIKCISRCRYVYIYIYIVCGACKPTNATRRGPSYFCLAVHWPPLVFPREKSLWWSLWYVSGLIIQSFILIIIW